LKGYPTPENRTQAQVRIHNAARHPAEYGRRRTNTWSEIECHRAEGFPSGVFELFAGFATNQHGAVITHQEEPLGFSLLEEFNRFGFRPKSS
jgi:hypothetical protein